jgi:hypothetical protein
MDKGEKNTSNIEDMIMPMLREIRADMAKMADAMNTQSVEMRAMLKHLGGIVDLQELDHEDIARIKVRLDRIETRLDLVDPADE